MAEILLSTLNARYLHSSFGLRYLLANLDELAPRAQIAEFDINQRPIDIAERILELDPKILGFGVYIWNASETLAVLEILKTLRPNLVVVLGGPEVSYETETSPLFRLADHIITGEADLKFRELCRALLEPDSPPQSKVLHAGIPDLAAIKFPYHLYTDTDLSQRIVYVEASRGCPFTCEFCLSSLEIPVRQFELEPFLHELEQLFERGLRHFKFVDRTFNLNIRTGSRILSFFLERYTPGLFIHFEMIPDRLPEALRSLITQFPAGALQFEVGIQTFNPEVASLISRRQDYEKLKENLNFLKAQTGVHVHADLIAGLPGESVESFGNGFDQLIALGPQEIQVGILKRLKGAPISRHTDDWQMRYSPSPPYEILENRLISFREMAELRRFARVWDLIGNSGNFVLTAPLLWSSAFSSAFSAVRRFSDFLGPPSSSGISLKRLTESLYQFLIQEAGVETQIALKAISDDYFRLGRSDKPAFLQEFEYSVGLHHERSKPKPSLSQALSPSRQNRHLAMELRPTTSPK